MAYQKLHIIIALLGALAAAVMSALNGDSLFRFSLKVVVSVVIFYTLGSIIKACFTAKLEVKDLEEYADNIDTGGPGETDEPDIHTGIMDIMTSDDDDE
ncbi:MAG: hypothetical protein FWE91_01590 [Defluviitaleaceae bacterium]|nr:hypothetical protein [Defluviitaleaceae bacterium]MCL2835732.1 hypothetical protein [Defluviitaleaceae bacterium]